MASINRVYAARLARMLVLGPMGESLGRVRDVVVSISIVRQQPRVLGLVIEMTSRRRIFVPILRVASIEPFYVMEMVKEAAELQRQGRDIIHMSIGEPDFTTPWHIREAAIYALERGKTGYTSNLGLLKLREVIGPIL